MCGLPTQAGYVALVDLFFAADQSFIDRLDRQNLVRPGSRQVYATGHIVITPAKTAGVEAKTLDVLLLDEPFSAVDALVRLQLRKELRTIQEQTGIPMVLVTHDLVEVRHVASYMVLYDHGRVRQTGTPAEVLAHPGSPWVESFLKAAEGTL